MRKLFIAIFSLILLFGCTCQEGLSHHDNAKTDEHNILI